MALALAADAKLHVRGRGTRLVERVRRGAQLPVALRVRIAGDVFTSPTRGRADRQIEGAYREVAARHGVGQTLAAADLTSGTLARAVACDALRTVRRACRRADARGGVAGVDWILAALLAERAVVAHRRWGARTIGSGVGDRWEEGWRRRVASDRWDGAGRSGGPRGPRRSRGTGRGPRGSAR